ncbi:MAG: hypothetical protein PHN82_10130 [bacterium]|nr:hypothetical protein [bacterium]
MSTILKALEKAQGVGAALPPPPAGAPGGPSPSRRLLRAILIAAGLVAASSIAGGLALRSLRRPARTAPPPPVLRLDGVIWDESIPLAIIEGRTVKRGDEVGGATVMEIGRDGVRVRYLEREYEIGVR